MLGFLLEAMVGVGIVLLASSCARKKTGRKIPSFTGDPTDATSGHWDDLGQDMEERVEETVEGVRPRFVAKASSREVTSRAFPPPEAFLKELLARRGSEDERVVTVAELRGFGARKEQFKHLIVFWAPT